MLYHLGSTSARAHLLPTELRGLLVLVGADEADDLGVERVEVVGQQLEDCRQQTQHRHKSPALQEKALSCVHAVWLLFECTFHKLNAVFGNNLNTLFEYADSSMCFFTVLDRFFAKIIIRRLFECPMSNSSPPCGIKCVGWGGVRKIKKKI